MSRRNDIIDSSVKGIEDIENGADERQLLYLLTMAGKERQLNKLVRIDAIKLPTNTSMNVTIKEIHLTGEWKWLEGKGDTCGICRAPFEGCCVDCKMPGDECPIVIGVCRHAFHMHCIVKWTNSQVTHQKPACPLCRQEWRFAH